MDHSINATGLFLFECWIRWAAFCRCLAAGLLIALGATSQGWVDVTPAQPGPSSSLLSGNTMCYDPIRMVTWLFGQGFNPSFWDGSAWTQSQIGGAPYNGFQNAYVYSCWSNYHNAVLLAVQGVTGAGSPAIQFYTWDGSAWVALASGPPAASDLAGSKLVSDDARNEVLWLCSVISSATLQVWSWNGSSWSLRLPATPVAVPISSGASQSAFYDPTRARAVLIQRQFNSVVDDYFEWSGSNWVQRYPMPRFSSLGQVAPAAQRGLSLAQTFFAASLVPRTFGLANGGFAELFLTDWPAWRQGAHMVYDSHRDRFVLHGGGSGGAGIFSDTWELALGPSSSYMTIGSGCPGPGGTPAMTPQSGALPRVNTQFTLQVSGMPWSGPAFMFLGFSDQFYGGVPLPANLAALGAPQCNLYISGDALYGMTNVLGLGTWTLGIPNVPGFTFFNQAIVFDPLANPLGMTLSNAGRAIVGQ